MKAKTTAIRLNDRLRCITYFPKHNFLIADDFRNDIYEGSEIIDTIYYKIWKWITMEGLFCYINIKDLLIALIIHLFALYGILIIILKLKKEYDQEIIKEYNKKTKKATKWP